MEGREECVFHSDHRFAFEALVCDMRRAGFITRQYANVMAMTVCSCRRKISHRCPISEQQVLEAVDHVMKPSNHNSLGALSRNALDLVTSAAHVAKSCPMTSQGRLTVVISQALLGDVTLLEEERAAAMATRGDAANATATKKGRAKPSANIIKLIIQKKKKKFPLKTTICLPVFGGSSHLLFQQKMVGHNFCRLCVKHQCVLELDSEATAKNMAANKPMTYVKAWYTSDAALNDVKQLLTHLAREIQTENDRRLHRRREEWKAYKQRTDAVYQSSNPTGRLTHNRSGFVEPEGYKEVLSRDFEVQVQIKTRNSKSKVKTAVQREDGSTYLEGHCYYCLLPFTHFKHGGHDVKECRHHPGYVIKEKWTCCQEKSDTGHPSYEEHAQSGCAVSRHSWRPHKKASRQKPTRKSPLSW